LLRSLNQASILPSDCLVSVLRHLTFFGISHGFDHRRQGHLSVLSTLCFCRTEDYRGFALFLFDVLLEDSHDHFNNVHAGEPDKHSDNKYTEATNYDNIHKSVVK
jgi:hypothetical protein